MQMKKETLRVGLVGCGNVGSGVAKILLENAENLARRAGRQLELVAVAVRDTKKARGHEVPEGLLCTDAGALVAREDVDIVVETIGGVGVALELIEAALRLGKHVVTANKEVVAKHGEALLELAREAGVNLYYEAAVGGGVPIIHGLKNSLSANNFSKVVGIVNGTTNFILSKMYQQGAEFEEVLAEAQRLGFAEADPTDDVDGYDVAYKLAILASIAFNSRFSYEDIYFEGIRKISARDIELARKFGYVIKLLAIGSEHGDGRVELRVHPVMVDEWHPLAGVNEAYNAVFVEGSYVGQAMFYGPGAGMCPTASAIVGDLMDLAMNWELKGTHPSLQTNFSQKVVLPMGEVQSEYYFRLCVANRPGVLAAIARACGEYGVSIKCVEQHEGESEAAELILITHKVAEAAMQGALKVINALEHVRALKALIRVGL